MLVEVGAEIGGSVLDGIGVVVAGGRDEVVEVEVLFGEVVLVTSGGPSSPPEPGSVFSSSGHSSSSATPFSFSSMTGTIPSGVRQ